MPTKVPLTFLNAPNLLSLSRLGMAVLVWPARHRPSRMLALLFAAGATDLLDGWLARRARRQRLAQGMPLAQVERIEAPGVWLDPLCDKIFMTSAAAAMWQRYRLPVPWLVMVATRELMLAPVASAYRLSSEFRRSHRLDFHAARIGKAATVTQFLAVASLLLRPSWSRAFAMLAGVTGFVAGSYYIRRAIIDAYGAGMASAERQLWRPKRPSSRVLANGQVSEE